MYENYGFDTEVLVASIRSKQHVIDAAIIGAQISTMPPKIIEQNLILRTPYPKAWAEL